MTKKLPPIASGWEEVLTSAPSDEERKNAENWRGVFYGGAIWLWRLYCGIDDPNELKEFLEALQAELDEYSDEMKQRTNPQ